MQFKVFTGVFLLTLSIFSPSALAYEALPSLPPFPKDNPSSPEKITLGKTLFFDPRISKDGTISCNSCHNVMASGEDNRKNSVGVRGQKGGRTAPTVWNAAFMTSMFWDSRMASLEDQAKGPMTNPIEMAMPNHDLVVDRIVSIPGYQELFAKAFGANAKININDLAKAIATYERTLITPNSQFDKFVNGDQSALSADAKAGLKLVESIGCVSENNLPCSRFH